MRSFIIILISCSQYFLMAGEGPSWHQPDSIPPPPGNPVTLTGPDAACVGDTSVYFTEVPVACTCQWRVDGVIQPDTTPQFLVNWTEAGSYIIHLIFICGGQPSEPEFILVEVDEVPNVSLGNDTTLLQGETLLLDAGNPGCTYLWSTGATTRTILVAVSGTYSVEVTGTCGSDSDEIEVTILVGLEEAVLTVMPVYYIREDHLNLISLPEGTSKVEVLGLSGQVVFEGTPAREIRIPSKGIYLVRITAAHRYYVKKIMAL